MAKNDQLDLALPAAILALGGMLPSPRDWGARHGGGAPGPGQASAQEDRVLAMLGSNAAARLRAFAYLARRMLRERTQNADMAEAALAAMDPVAEPGEALLVARDAVGRMVADGAQCPWNPLLFLPARSLQWMCGGHSSLGPLLPQRLAAARLKGAGDEMAEEIVPPPLPAKTIRDRIGGRMAGMEDGQLDLVSGRLALHMVRARMLASGEGPGTPNEVLLVMGTESGIGKTYLCEVAGQATGLPCAIANAAEMTASGYVGSSCEDGLRPLLAAAKGRVESCRFGLMGYDEIFRRAGSANESTVNSTAVQGEMLRLVQGQLTQVGGKRSGFEQSFWVDTRGMFFFLCGCASGLDRFLQRRMGRLAIGFAGGAGGRATQALLRDALGDYGIIPELQTRVTGIVLVRPPSLSALSAAASGVIASYNRLLASRGCTLSFEDGAVAAMARHCLSVKSFFRGLAAITSSMATDAVALDKRDAVVVKAADVGRAIARMEEGVAGLLEPARAAEEGQEERNAYGDHGCASANG